MEFVWCQRVFPVWLAITVAGVVGCRPDLHPVVSDGGEDKVVDVAGVGDAAGGIGDDVPVEVGVDHAEEPTMPDAGVEAGVRADVAIETAPALPRVPADQFAGELRASSFAALGTSWSRGLASAGGVVVAANPDSNSITVLSGTPLVVQAEIPVGRDPRTVTVTPDGRYAVVVNRGDGTVSIVDLPARREAYFFEVRTLPYGAVIAGGRIYVTEWATGSLIAFDPIARRLLARAVVAPFPAGIAHCGPPTCALPGGRGLLVTHFYSGQLSLIDPETFVPTQVISTGADTNFSQQVAIAPDGKRAYLPQTRSFADNPIRQFDSTVFPVVNVVDLATLTVRNDARITLDTADQPVGIPFAVEFLKNGERLVVANAASDDLSVVELATGNKIAHIEIGAAPQGLAVADDGTIYVNQVLDGTLGMVKVGGAQAVRQMPLTKLPLPSDVLRGKRLFWSANRTDLARDQWMSCATCHFDGFHDGRTWRSFPDGVRNTTPLFNLAETLPLHWSGDLDEIHDVESTVRFVQAGKGLAPAPQIDTLGAALKGTSPDLDALAAFLTTLRPPTSPHANNPAAINRGQAVFNRLACATCHAGPHFTDRRNHDVGTGDPTTERNTHGRGTTFDTPSLRALWLTAPYLHDGSAPTLEAVFTRGTAHRLSSDVSTAERAELIAYLRSL
ncbi:MAG TPA: hypothetical protein VGG33_21035 [Polyangia bacterium]